MINNILHLLIIQLSLVSFFNAQVIAPYKVCSQPIKVKIQKMWGIRVVMQGIKVEAQV